MTDRVGHLRRAERPGGKPIGAWRGLFCYRAASRPHVSCRSSSGAGDDDAVGLRPLSACGGVWSIWFPAARRPFHNDCTSGDHVFAADAAHREFRAELYSTTFDARRSLL
jgi:hypothetical protein